jgi:hypothetical protein
MGKVTDNLFDREGGILLEGSLASDKVSMKAKSLG